MIDLRSDTVTRPTAAMREAMARAEVGDDGFGEDPSVTELEHEVAALLGKEAALFVPSGIMSNTIATLVHTRHGDEVIVGEGAHMALYEGGAGPAIAGVSYAQVGRRGTFDGEDVRAAVRPDKDHAPRTSLVALENTHNRAGGKVFPEQKVAHVAQVAREFGLPLHLDGARLWNASVRSGRSLSELAAPFDSVSVCFSKGLGAPVGSALVGARAAIAEARRFRRRLGGGMRQAGVLAAAASYALQHHRERLAEDHENAALIAAELERVGYPVRTSEVETNLVFVRLPKGVPERIVAYCAKAEVRVGALDSRTLRIATHLDVTRTQSMEAARVLCEAFTALELGAEVETLLDRNGMSSQDDG
jgi:threonine aldolase